MFRSMVRLCTGFALAAVLSIPMGASAQSIFLSSTNTGSFASGEFGSFDVVSHVYTPIASTGANIFQGLTFAPNGTLYGVTDGSTLYTINPTTGAFSAVGSTGLGNVVAVGLAARSDNALFMIDGGFNTPNSLLYTLNPNTGAGTQVGDLGHATTGTITFGPTNTLYETNNAALPDTLDTVNQGTGATSAVGNTAFNNITGLTFVNSTLYGFTEGSNTGANRNFITLDPTTGLGTFQSTYQLTGLNGVLAAAFVPTAVPEPSTLALCGSLGLAGAGFLTRRKRARRA